MQNCAAPRRGGGLADPVLVHEQLRAVQAAALLAEHRARRHAHVLQRRLRVVGRHVEGPVVVVDLHARRARRDEERADPRGLADLARRAREDDVRARRTSITLFQRFIAVDDPVVAVAARGRLQPGRVAAVVRLGEAEGELDLAVDQRPQVLLLLLLGAVLVQDERERLVGHHRRLVRELGVQAGPARGQVLAHHRHGEVREVAAADRRRERELVEAGRDRRAGGPRPAARASARWGCRRARRPCA